MCSSAYLLAQCIQRINNLRGWISLRSQPEEILPRHKIFLHTSFVYFLRACVTSQCQNCLGWGVPVSFVRSLYWLNRPQIQIGRRSQKTLKPMNNPLFGTPSSLGFRLSPLWNAQSLAKSEIWERQSCFYSKELRKFTSRGHASSLLQVLSLLLTLFRTGGGCGHFWGYGDRCAKLKDL